MKDLLNRSQYTEIGFTYIYFSCNVTMIHLPQVRSVLSKNTTCYYKKTISSGLKPWHWSSLLTLETCITAFRSKKHKKLNDINWRHLLVMDKHRLENVPVAGSVELKALNQWRSLPFHLIGRNVGCGGDSTYKPNWHTPSETACNNETKALH